MKNVMLGFFKKIFCNSTLPDIFSPKYEEFLLRNYGACDEIQNNINLLIISDTHGCLNEEEFKKFLLENEYDLCIMLGDHYTRDIDVILKYVDKSKVFGILGNHDYNYLKEYNIPNLNGVILEFNGVKLLGIEGSFKYKPVDFPSFTQEESITFLEQQEKVDILLSHDKKFDFEKIKDPAHQGLIGITNYIFKKKIPIHIHGHIHENYEKTLINNTKEYSVFGYKIIKIKK